MKSLEFCYHLAVAVVRGEKTLTYKPLAPGEQLRLAEGITPPAPFSTGDIVPMMEPWRFNEPAGTGISVASSSAPEVVSFGDPPAGFLGAHMMPSDLAVNFIAILSIELVRLDRITEEDAKACATKPARACGSYRDEFIRQWSGTYRGALAWGRNPACWRIELRYEGSK